MPRACEEVRPAPGAFHFFSIFFSSSKWAVLSSRSTTSSSPYSWTKVLNSITLKGSLPAQGEKNGRHALSHRLRATPSPWDVKEGRQLTLPGVVLLPLLLDLLAPPTCDPLVLALLVALA